MINYNAWFSIALEYGLSVFSLGKTGSRSSDGQLLTGGLTAVESLLSSEIGLTKKEGFVIDHGNSHMERIPLLNDDLNLYAQFLIQTSDGEKIDVDYKELAKSFIIELTSCLFDSPYIIDLKTGPKTLSISKLSDFIIKSHEIAHRKIKIKSNNNLLSDLVTPIILDSFSSIGYSKTLNKLSTMKSENFYDYIQKNRGILLDNLKLDILNRLIDENPLTFLITQPSYFKNEFEVILFKELELIGVKQTNTIVLDIIEEIFSDNSLREIIQKFDINSITKDKDIAKDLIEQLLKNRLIKKSPLIFLVDPDFNFSEIIQEKVIDRFLNEFNLGNVLSNIAKSLILKAHPEDEMQANLVLDFFVNLSQIFPGGLPNQLWIIIVNLMQIYASEARFDLLSVNKLVNIEEIYWKTISENIKEYRVFNILNFDLAESGSELISLFDGVRETIGKSFRSFYTNFIWDFTTNSFGSFFNSLQMSIITNYQAMQTVYYLVKYLNFIRSKKFTYFDPIELGFNFQEFKKLAKPEITSSRAVAIHDMGELNLENITLYYLKKIETEYKWIKDKILESEHETILSEVPKIIQKEKIKSIKLKIDEKGEIKFFDLGKIKNQIIKEVNKQFEGDSFLTNTDFLFIYCTTLLFDSLPSDLTNKAIDLAIYKPKSSKLISSAIEKGKPSYRTEESNYFFIENLKKEIILIGNTVLKDFISSKIHQEISKERYPLKTLRDKTDEILVVKIAELDKSFKKWIDEDIKIHPRIYLLKEKNKIEVFLEVVRRPNTGIKEVQNLMDAVALQTYNNEMIRLGVFIESLKIVASTLGEYERNRVQNLFTSIGLSLIAN